MAQNFIHNAPSGKTDDDQWHKTLFTMHHQERPMALEFTKI